MLCRLVWRYRARNSFSLLNRKTTLPIQFWLTPFSKLCLDEQQQHRRALYRLDCRHLKQCNIQTGVDRNHQRPASVVAWLYAPRVAGLPPGTSMSWNYYVPRYFSDQENPAVAAKPTSFIRNMSFSQVYFLIEEGAPVHNNPFMMAGLWDEGNNAFASSSFHYPSEGQWNGITMNPFPNPGEYDTVKNGGVALATYESASYQRQVFVGSASVEVVDKDLPELSETKSVASWLSSLPGPAINYNAFDLGLGLLISFG